MKRSLSTGLYMLLLVLLGCESKESRPLEDFYPFADVNRIRLQADRTDYYIGIDSLLIPKVNALDSTGQNKILPDSAFAYFLNGQRVASRRLIFTSPGSQTITAKFGKLTSNDLVINAIDPATIIQSLQLTLDKSSGVPFMTADGISRVRFQTAILRKDGKALPVKLKVQLLANGQLQPNTEIFQTRTAGTYRIMTTAYGKESNAITVQARPLETYPVVKIPVIFHMLGLSTYSGSYQALLDEVNQIYRNKGPVFSSSDNPSGVDTFIEFELASRDPVGALLARAGEDLINTTQVTYKISEVTTRAFEKHYWNPNNYLNVYVFTCNDCTGIGGFAVGQPPLASQGFDRKLPPSFAYATFLTDIKALPSVHVLAHEFGHMLDMNHTFNGNGGVYDVNPCDKDSDFCEDTPLCNPNQPGGLSAYEQIACSGQHYFSTNPMGHDPFNLSFTYNQRQRMRNRIENGLWLPTPNNRNLGGGRLASKGNSASYAPVKPTIVICPAR